VTRRDGSRLQLEGAVVVDTVAGLLPESARHVREGAEVVDLALVTEVDSAAVALALALVREARSAGRELAFANVPDTMRQLAALYGVADFLRLDLRA
jgi:phospholipid transport system transporter-binding protein